MQNFELSSKEIQDFTELHALRLMDIYEEHRINVVLIKKFLGLFTVEDFEEDNEKLKNFLRGKVNIIPGKFEARIDEGVGIFMRRTEESYTWTDDGYQHYHQEIEALKAVQSELRYELKDCKRDEFRERAERIITKGYYPSIRVYLIKRAILDGSFDMVNFGVFEDQDELKLILGSLSSSRKDGVRNRGFSREMNYDYFENDGWDFFEMFILLDIISDGVLDLNFIAEEYGEGVFLPEPEPVVEPEPVIENNEIMSNEESFSSSDDDSSKSYGSSDDYSDYGSDDSGGFDGGDCGGGDW